MSIQRRVNLLLLGSILIYIALAALAQLLIILPSFYSLEQEDSAKDMDRVVQAIDRQIQNMGTSAADWAFWDDTYQYAQDHNAAFAEANLNTLALDGLHINLFYIFDASGQLLWGMVYDLKNQKELIIPGISDRLARIHLTQPESTADGVLNTSMGPMLISARPILTNDRQGPVMGTLVQGRFLDAADIASQVRIGLTATPLDTGKTDPATATIMAKMAAPGETLITGDAKVNQVYRVFPGLDTKPALLLRVDVPREISARGVKSAEFSMFSILGSGLVLLAVLTISLRRSVLFPLRHLTDRTVRIGREQSESTPITRDQKDEIGILGQEFDRMVERLEVTRKSLIEQSYSSGMAEVATGILHNVGNVLNSVNVSITLLMDQLRASRVVNVAKVACLMAEPQGEPGHFLTDDPRGQQIPAYLASLATALQEERQLMLNETTSLKDQIEHMKGIIAMQQGYGRAAKINQTVEAEQLMEDAIKINEDALVRHKVRLLREYQPVPALYLNKHKVIQILVNLISNAKYACSESNSSDRTIIVRIFDSKNEHLSLQVADNGVGIAPENLTRIFQYGFSTRKSGNGFGLHVSALAARELGGTLSAHSDGPGCGAVFTLDLPLPRAVEHEP